MHFRDSSADLTFQIDFGISIINFGTKCKICQNMKNPTLNALIIPIQLRLAVEADCKAFLLEANNFTSCLKES